MDAYGWLYLPTFTVYILAGLFWLDCLCADYIYVVVRTATATVLFCYFCRRYCSCGYIAGHVALDLDFTRYGCRYPLRLVPVRCLVVFTLICGLIRDLDTPFDLRLPVIC